jgi:hypothetical protein
MAVLGKVCSAVIAAVRTDFLGQHRVRYRGVLGQEQLTPGLEPLLVRDDLGRTHNEAPRAS